MIPRKWSTSLRVSRSWKWVSDPVWIASTSFSLTWSSSDCRVSFSNWSNRYSMCFTLFFSASNIRIVCPLIFVYSLSRRAVLRAISHWDQECQFIMNTNYRQVTNIAYYFRHYRQKKYPMKATSRRGLVQDKWIFRRQPDPSIPRSDAHHIICFGAAKPRCASNNNLLYATACNKYSSIQYSNISPPSLGRYVFSNGHM